MPYLACTHSSGPLTVLDIRGPVVRFCAESQGDAGAFRAAYGRTGCACIRTNRKILHLYSYEVAAPRFKLTLPFEGSSISLDEQAGYLFIGSSAGNLGIWDVSSGQLLACPALHTREIVSVSRRGDFILTAGGEGVVALWSLQDLFEAHLSGAPATALASSARHGLPLVAAAFDQFSSRQRPLFHTAGKDRVLRTWEVGLGEAGLALVPIQEVTLPEAPLGFAVSPDGARVYVVDRKGVRTFLCSRAGPLETVCEAKTCGAELGGGEKSVEFCSISSSHASSSIFVGTSTGSVLALLPGGGTQVMRTRSDRPVEQMAQLDDYMESKEQCLFATTLGKDPRAFSLASQEFYVSLPLQYCSVGRPTLLTNEVLVREISEIVSGREQDALAEAVQDAGLLTGAGTVVRPGAQAREKIAQDPYSLEQNRMAAERAGSGAAEPGADIYRVTSVKFAGDVYDELNNM